MHMAEIFLCHGFPREDHVLNLLELNESAKDIPKNEKHCVHFQHGKRTFRIRILEILKLLKAKLNISCSH